MARVLIVDDEDAIRNLFKIFVEKQGHEAICAGTGAEALEKMDRKPALVLLDMFLPDMFGIQVLERIKEIDPSVEVIMVTGEADDELGIESLKKGAFDFLTKPFSLENLGALMALNLPRTDPATKAEADAVCSRGVTPSDDLRDQESG